ncbi:MAG: hypothetical protein GY953_25070 [bacterium]|nr:hypothetical protein [bacterium]
MRTELMELSGFGRALSTEPGAVAKVAIASLGKKRVVSPGLLHKFIAFSTRIQPRLLNTKVFQTVVSRAHGSSASAVAARRNVHV